MIALIVLVLWFQFAMSGVPETARHNRMILAPVVSNAPVARDETRGSNNPTANSPNNSATEGSKGETEDLGEDPDPLEIYLNLAFSGSVLIFGFLVLLLEVFVILKTNKKWDDASIKLFGITVIVIAALFVIPAGYNQQQIAPMMGLLGAITGYLLGRSEKGDVPK